MDFNVSPDEMSLEVWRSMSPDEQRDYYVALDVGIYDRMIVRLLQLPGAGFEDAVTMFAATAVVTGSAAEAVKLVRRLGERWMRPEDAYPDTVGEQVVIAGWHYSNRPDAPMSVFPDPRARDRRSCPMRAAEIAAEFLAAYQALQMGFAEYE